MAIRSKGARPRRSGSNTAPRQFAGNRPAPPAALNRHEGGRQTGNPLPDAESLAGEKTGEQRGGAMLLFTQFGMAEEIAAEGRDGGIQTCNRPQETRT